MPSALRLTYMKLLANVPPLANVSVTIVPEAPTAVNASCSASKRILGVGPGVGVGLGVGGDGVLEVEDERVRAAVGALGELLVAVGRDEEERAHGVTYRKMPWQTPTSS